DMRQQCVTERGVLALEAIIGAGAELVKHAHQLRPYRGTTRLPRDEAHLSDCRVRPQATYADRNAASVHQNSDAAVQDEMHGVGRIPLADDNFLRLKLDPLAMPDQLVSVLRTAERFSKPVAQRAGLAGMRLVRLDHRVLTRLKGSVEIGRHNNVIGNKPGGTEGVLHVAREARENDPCAALVSDMLDLCEAECGG